MGDYCCQNFEHLTEEKNLGIKELHILSIGAYYLIVYQSAVLIIGDVDRSLKQITTITEQTEVHHEKLTNVQGILDLANAVFTLSVAVISLDTKEITSSIKNLLG